MDDSPSLAGVASELLSPPDAAAAAPEPPPPPDGGNALPPGPAVFPIDPGVLTLTALVAAAAVAPGVPGVNPSGALAGMRAVAGSCFPFRGAGATVCAVFSPALLSPAALPSAAAALVPGLSPPLVLAVAASEVAAETAAAAAVPVGVAARLLLLLAVAANCAASARIDVTVSVDSVVVLPPLPALPTAATAPSAALAVTAAVPVPVPAPVDVDRWGGTYLPSALSCSSYSLTSLGSNSSPGSWMDNQSGPKRNSASDSHDRGSGCWRTAGAAIPPASSGADAEVVLEATGVEAVPVVVPAAATEAPALPFAAPLPTTAPLGLLDEAPAPAPAPTPLAAASPDDESTRAQIAVVRSAATRASRTLQCADVRFDDSTRLANEAPN